MLLCAARHLVCLLAPLDPKYCYVCGARALYVVVNPGKASYSIAPTMAVCAIVGYLTSFWLLKANRSQLLVILIGLLLGLSVNLRLSNAILSAGYFLFFAISCLRSRQLTTFAQGIGFGMGFLVGMTPTLIANAINAGSPFTTTYGGVDVAPPEFKFGIFMQYAADLQFALILLAVASTIYRFRWKGQTRARQVGLIVAGNLLVNLAFFLSHTVFTQYYMIPIAMLSLWSLSFAHLMQEVEVAKVIPAA